jgi:hypothetical protein
MCVKAVGILFITRSYHLFIGGLRLSVYRIHRIDEHGSRMRYETTHQAD